MSESCSQRLYIIKNKIFFYFIYFRSWLHEANSNTVLVLYAKQWKIYFLYCNGIAVDTFRLTFLTFLYAWCNCFPSDHIMFQAISGKCFELMTVVCEIGLFSQFLRCITYVNAQNEYYIYFCRFRAC